MKSMCQEARRNSPSVADRRPTSSCMRTASRIASSSTRAQLVGVDRARRRASRGPRSSSGGRSRLPTWSARNGGVAIALPSAAHPTAAAGERPRPHATRSAARSPIMTDGACVFPVVTVGHYRRVGDPEALDAAHPELGVDDRELVDAHPARADLVVVGDRVCRGRTRAARRRRTPSPGTAPRASTPERRLPADPRQSSTAAVRPRGRRRSRGGGVEQRRGLGVGRREAQRAAADGPHHATHQREAVRRAVLSSA